MEVDGGNEKKFAVMAYELIGTCIFTYTILIGGLTNVFAIIGMYFVLLAVTWNVSGGHFNPALTLSIYIGQKNFAGNAVVLAFILVA